MQITVSGITTIVCCLVSLVSLCISLKGSKRTDTKDIEERAAQNATVNVKLDSISTMLSDIKSDVSDTKRDISALSERVATVESSVKSAHHRVDVLERKGEHNERNN